MNRLTLILPVVLASRAARAQDGPPSVATEATPLPDALQGAVPEAGAGVALPATDPATALPAPGLSITPADAAAAMPRPSISSYHANLWELVLVAHPVVQAVMALLAMAAFVALTILLYKSVEIGVALVRVNRAAQGILSAGSLAEAAMALRGSRGASGSMVQAAAAELSPVAADPDLLPGARLRTHATLERIEAGAALHLRRGTGILASIGSLGPFIGLFGTVFGIMNSFLAIAATKTTNLAVVAPGIAEALLATAIGLAAAIPAVLIDNLLGRRIAAFRHRLSDLAIGIETLQSRELDRLAAPLRQVARAAE